MAMSKAGALRIDVSADTVQFDKGMSNVQRALANAGKRFEALGAKAADWGKKLSVAASLPIAGIAAASIKGAQAQAAAMAQVDAAIKSMGNAAKLSSADLSAFADQLELKSLFDADEILKSSTANLLTFGNVAGDTFKRAQQSAVDLATRMEGDLQGATLMVGKALNDPVKGLTALSRAGIQFTEQQKEQIKAMVAAGDTAGAQAIMLAELEKQFGGAAEAAAKADPMREVMVKLGQAGDVIGAKLLPLIPPLTDAIVKVLDGFTNLSPAMQQVVLIGGGVAAAFGPALVAFGSVVSVIGKLLPLVTKLPLLLNAVGIAFRFMLGPIGLAITAIGLAYAAWKNWDKIEPILRNLYNGVKTWIMDRLGAVWDWLKGKLLAVGKWFYDLYDAVVGNSYVPDMVDEIGQHIARLQGNMVKPIEGMTAKAKEAFAQLQTDIGGIMSRLFPTETAIAAIVSDIEKVQKASDALLPSTQKAEALRRLYAELAELRAKAAGESADKLGLWSSEDQAGWDASAGQGKSEFPAPALPSLEEGKDRTTALIEALRRLGDQGDDAFSRVAGAIGDVIAGLKTAGDQTAQLGSQMGGLAGAVETIFGTIFGSKVGKIAGAIAGAAGAIFGGFRANGGPVSSGKAYIVGERGPEMFLPKMDGRIVPNMALGGISPTKVGGGYLEAPNGGKPQRVDIQLHVTEAPSFASKVQYAATGAAVSVNRSTMAQAARKGRQRMA